MELQQFPSSLHKYMLKEMCGEKNLYKKLNTHVWLQ